MKTAGKNIRTGKPHIAITMGDHNGIGPEVALKAALSPQVRRVCSPVLIGSPEALRYYARRSHLKVTLRELRGNPGPLREGELGVISPESARVPTIVPGKRTPAAGVLAGEAITKGVRMCTAGIVEALVTAPTSKEVMNKAGFRFPGQTEMVASLSGTKHATMMLISGTFRVALATVHVPLSRVASLLSRELIKRKIAALQETLRRDFGLRRPRIAVLGLNPHAGENGLIGDEERRTIAPAIRSAQRLSILAEGPFPADGFFATHAHRKYDAVLAMYHDQGLIPLKMSGFDTGVNYSSGLSIVRTSPDHGTAYQLAGKGIARPESMIAAIMLAATIARRRRK